MGILNMTEDAKAFVEHWVEDNIHPTGYEPEGDATEARKAMLACFRDADRAGISRRSIQDAIGDLQEYMVKAIENVNDAEVARLAAKDD
jgi:hypothetical protein